MIYFYSKRFRFAPSFNNTYLIWFFFLQKTLSSNSAKICRGHCLLVPTALYEFANLLFCVITHRFFTATDDQGKTKQEKSVKKLPLRRKYFNFFFSFLFLCLLFLFARLENSTSYKHQRQLVEFLEFHMKQFIGKSDPVRKISIEKN